MDNTQPPMNQMNQPMMNRERSVGPVIGLIIILAIIVIGGIYFWHSRQTGQNPAAPVQNSQNTQDQSQATGTSPTVESIKSQSSSDDVTAIQNDLSNINQNDINNLDTELK